MPHDKSCVLGHAECEPLAQGRLFCFPLLLLFLLLVSAGASSAQNETFYVEPVVGDDFSREAKEKIREAVSRGVRVARHQLAKFAVDATRSLDTTLTFKEETSYILTLGVREKGRTLCYRDIVIDKSEAFHEKLTKATAMVLTDPCETPGRSFDRAKSFKAGFALAALVGSGAIRNVGMDVNDTSYGGALVWNYSLFQFRLEFDGITADGPSFFESSLGISLLPCGNFCGSSRDSALFYFGAPYFGGDFGVASVRTATGSPISSQTFWGITFGIQFLRGLDFPLYIDVGGQFSFLTSGSPAPAAYKARLGLYFDLGD